MCVACENTINTLLLLLFSTFCCRLSEIGGWVIFLLDRVPTVSAERTVIGRVKHRPL